MEDSEVKSAVDGGRAESGRKAFLSREKVVVGAVRMSLIGMDSAVSVKLRWGSPAGGVST